MAYSSGNDAHGAMSRFGGANQGSSYTFRDYRSDPSKEGNWNTGGRMTGQGSLAGGIDRPNGDTNRVGMPVTGARTAIPIPVPKPVVTIPPTAAIPPAVNPPRAYPVRPVQRPFSTYVRSPYSNDPTWSPKSINRSPTPQGSTHYKNRGPEAGQFRDTGDRVGGGGGGGGGGGWARGGNVDRPSILQMIKQRQGKGRRAQAIDTAAPAQRPAPAQRQVTQRVTPVKNKTAPKKTPWKKAGTPTFARGGAVEKFMQKYPDFKLA